MFWRFSMWVAISAFGSWVFGWSTAPDVLITIGAIVGPAFLIRAACRSDMRNYDRLAASLLASENGLDYLRRNPSAQEEFLAQARGRLAFARTPEEKELRQGLIDKVEALKQGPTVVQ